MNWLEKGLANDGALYIKNDNEYRIYQNYREYYNGQLRAIGKKFHTLITLTEDEKGFKVDDLDEIIIEKEFFNVDNE